MKSTVDEIRERFDHDVERFANFETGQGSAMDARLCMDLVAEAASVVTPGAKHLLDIGCGAGNYALAVLDKLPGMGVTLVDLSRPMLDRAEQRVGAATAGRVEAVQGDIRAIDVPEASVDVVVAAMVLHHLRSVEEWRAVCAKLYRALRPGGSVWIVDLVSHENPAVQAAMWRGYGEYLVSLRDAAYREAVFAYVDKEDSPTTTAAMLGHLGGAGFVGLEVLHKRCCFVALGGEKRG